MKRVKFYFTTVSFILSIWSTNLAAQEGRPPISLYYYDDEWKDSTPTPGGEPNDSTSKPNRRILMCVSSADGSRCVLFSLKGGKLHGMEPHRQTFEKLAHPALVTFQRILVLSQK